MNTQLLTTLLRWFEDHGVVWDQEHQSIRHAIGTTGPALGVFAKTDIPMGHRLCFIPKTAVLSARNVAIADALEQAQLGGGLALNVAVMHELAHGPASPWHGYLQSLPHREHLPVFWSDQQLQHLEGCALRASIDADRAHMREDYDDIVAPFIEQHRDAFPDHAGTTYEAYSRAASWVASRAFCVDHWHGDSLVPFADVYNHKASLVVLGDQYRLDGVESDDDDEDDDDEDDHDEDDDDEDDDDEDGGESDGAEDHATGGQQAAHSTGKGNAGAQHMPTGNAANNARQQDDAVAAMEAANEGVDPALRLEIAICSIQEGGMDALEIVAAQPLKQGQEVHNTYGEHSNGQLLNKHGFTLCTNPFDVVEVPKASVIAVAEQQLGKASWQHRAAFLEEHSALLDDDEEPLLLLAPHAVSLSLVVLLRAATMPDEAFAALEGVHELVPAGDCDKEDRWDASTDPEECMTQEMRRMLCMLCTEQLGRYPASLEASQQQWKELGGGLAPGHGCIGEVLSTAVAVDEDVATHRAALGLRIGEQQILHNVLSMLQPDEPVAKRGRRGNKV